MMNSEALANEAIARGALQKQSELARLIDFLPDHMERVLEIGSWNGGMLWLWQRLAAEVWSIDVRPVPRAPWMEPKLHLVTADSARAAELVPDHFDLVFIDGDHSTLGVNRDWRLYGGRGDFVVFHDIVPWTPTQEEINQGYGDRGVEALWHKLWRSYVTLEFVDPGSQRWPDGRTMDHREGGIGVVVRGGSDGSTEAA